MLLDILGVRDMECNVSEFLHLNEGIASLRIAEQLPLISVRKGLSTAETYRNLTIPFNEIIYQVA